LNPPAGIQEPDGKIRISLGFSKQTIVMRAQHYHHALVLAISRHDHIWLLGSLSRVDRRAEEIGILVRPDGDELLRAQWNNELSIAICFLTRNYRAAFGIVLVYTRQTAPQSRC